MKYEDLSDEVKILIEKEVNNRFNFKMNEFLTSIKNMYPFWLQSPDPYTNMMGNNLKEHWVILHDRFKKEMEMSLPNENITLEKLNSLNSKFENDFNVNFGDKLKGKIDSRIIYNLHTLMSKYIERAFFI